MTKTVVAAALGECVHVAGVMNFCVSQNLRDGRRISRSRSADG
jgi:hypothetical protein